MDISKIHTTNASLKYFLITVIIVSIMLLSMPAKADLLSYHGSGSLFVVDIGNVNNCGEDPTFAYSQTDNSLTETTSPKLTTTAGVTVQGVCAAPPASFNSHIDLGASLRVTGISVYDTANTGRTVVFWGSNTTGSNYQNLGSVVLNTAGGWKNFTVTDTTHYRYIGMSDPAAGVNGANERISEIVILGNNTPNITSWGNTKTNNQAVDVYVNPLEGIVFNATANQTITTWSWYLDKVLQSNNFDNISLINMGVGNHTLNVTGTNANGTTNSVNWSILSSHTVLPNNCCDPSGYVFDQQNNPISGVKVVISNATYTDACILTSCYTNAAGLWNGTIYADGTYTITASKQGYNTNITVQSLTIGGTANDIILNGSQATLTGHVYTNISGTGTTAIKGDLKDLRIDSCGVAGQGGTLTIGTTGGSSYVLKLIDVDSGNQQSVWQLLKDGTVIYDNVLVNTNEPTNLKIYETFYETAYVGIRVSNVFQGSRSEFNTATTCGSFEHVKKSVSIFEYLLRLAGDLILSAAFDAKLGGVSSQATIANWGAILTSTDGTNIPTSPLQRASQGIFYNASSGKDVVGYVDFHVDNRASIFNFNMAFSAESTTGSAGKLSIGYTDNCVTCTSDNGFTDVIMVNQKESCQANMNGYCTPQHDFKSIDADGDGTIRVWFKFNSGYSNFWLYEFYLNAWGTTAQVPLPGVFIYSVNGTNTTTTDSLGAYTLYLSLKNNTVYYTKVGYESKHYTFLFNSTNVTFTQDVVLNATNATTNTTSEYIIVPNFVQGVATNGNFKTLGHTSLLGGYQISICPQLGGDCKAQSVPANTEGTFALDPNLPIGTYKADLTGFLGGLLDISRDIIKSTNFTVTSSTPRVDWANGADGYFLGDTMILSVYVPTGTQYVNVTYLTNGSRIYSNGFSATGTVQNTTFPTNSNLTLSSYQPGQYQACIDSGNCATTTLYNTSNTDYTLSAPATVNDGETFNIIWKSPHTSTLQIVDQVNNVRYTQDVPVGNSLTGSVPVDTAVFTHNVTSITTTLNRNGVVVATALTNITINPGSPSGAGNNLVGSQSKIYTLPWIGLMLLIVVIFGLIKNQVEGRTFAFAVAITTSLEALFGLWNEWGIYITIFSWLLVGVFLKVEKTVED